MKQKPKCILVSGNCCRSMKGQSKAVKDAINCPDAIRQNHISVDFRLWCLFIKEDNGGYSVSCPALKGCFSQGATLTEAKEMIAEAISLILEYHYEKSDFHKTLSRKRFRHNFLGK